MAKLSAFGIKFSKGSPLKYAGTGIFAGLRRLLGWFAAYTLVLQLLVIAVAGAQFSAKAADQNWSFFEICYGKGASDGELPEGKPDKQASKSFCCAVCANAVAGTAPHIPSVVTAEFTARIISWSVRDDFFARTDFVFSQRQRAPPFEA
jgi:hypothetical protein